MKLKNLFNKIMASAMLLVALTVLPSSTHEKKAVKRVIKLGFIPLTDCSPLIMAKEYGLFKKYGVEVELSKEASWANIRDKILTGELDGAHCLFGMPFSVYTGVGGKAGTEMKIAMILNTNGQAVTLSKEFCGKIGFKKTDKAAAVIDAKIKSGKPVTVAATFPGGTHDIWMRNWLSLCGIPQNSVKQITIPPPQMVANMKVANMDAYCVGEPWNGVAVAQEVGFTQITTQDIWKDHPEKALVVNKTFAETNREDLKNVMKAILEACKLLDKPANRAQSAQIVGQTKYINAPAAVIDGRLKGIYEIGCGIGTEVYKDYMNFYKNGTVNYPRKSYGIWFMAQYVRFDMVKTAPDYKAIADKLIMQDLYVEVAKEMGMAIPTDDMKPFSLTIDKTMFDPANPAEYLKVVKK
jgi:nitrate/nitrite transport system substrate-binding protein